MEPPRSTLRRLHPALQAKNKRRYADMSVKVRINGRDFLLLWEEFEVFMLAKGFDGREVELLEVRS